MDDHDKGVWLDWAKSENADVVRRLSEAVDVILSWNTDARTTLRTYHNMIGCECPGGKCLL